MSDQTLRDLLEERVSDLGTRDLSAGAWHAGKRLRRRRRTTVLAGVAATAALVLGVTAVATRDRTPDPGPVGPPPATSGPDAKVDGARVWWGPDLAEEEALPQVGSPLPEQVDLTADRDGGSAPAGPATAAFAVLDERAGVVRVVLVDGRGTRTLDVSRLDPVTKPNGYRLPPVGATMLAPDGRTLAFPQDGSVVFHDLTGGGWSEVPVDRPTVGLRWAGDRTVVLEDGTGVAVDGTLSDLDLPRPTVLGLLGAATAHGPSLTGPDGVATAQAFGYGARVPARSGSLDDPETVVVDDGTAPEILTISTGVAEGRFKDCCPVAGWLDADTVVYESHSAEPRLVSWDVGTRAFGLVARIVGLSDPGESYVASYARLDG